MGHLRLAVEAYKRLGLNEVWMLVSPQNPHKSKKDLEDYHLRVEQCQILTKDHPFIKVSTYEMDKGLYKTTDTLKMLTKQHPDVQFAWLMGCENWTKFHTWNGWEDIINTVPIVSFYRDEEGSFSIKSPATNKYKQFRAKAQQKIGQAPEWRILFMPPHAGRATNIRKDLKSGRTPQHLTDEQLLAIKKRHSFCVGT
ncbi:MAG TPA: nicotinate-nicotinamide nucleotide adenylyltransferase [Nitrospinaceae bacterium]|nr:nicotinate-nicotinamide nucleotide adenylyltransferase [Nitrospinaceae bacterium]